MPISSEQLVEEIAAKLEPMIATHGPHSVATFLGNGVLVQPAATMLMVAFLSAIGSPMFYSTVTIDQPGLAIAKALHGDWQGGRIHSSEWNAMLLVGGNPVVSKQHLPENPAWQLKRLTRDGLDLIVIDPRRTESARRATVHLQAIPGEDPTVLAGLLHLIFALDGVDKAFASENAQGVEDLRRAVAGFTPDYVAARAGLDVDELMGAAQILVDAKRGDTALGVGPSMATRGNLSSYLALCIQTLRGWWARAGDTVSRPRMLTPRRDWRAQPIAPSAAWGFGHRTSVRGLQQTTAGMPAAALPELMMTDGPDRIRALFLHGGASHSWPDSKMVTRALGELDLLVVHDVEVSSTSALADYVIATYDQLELPASSQTMESAGDSHPGYGWTEPYAFYRPAVIDPPDGADLMEAWQVYYRVAQKLGLPLHVIDVGSSVPRDPIAIDMANEPTVDDLLELACADSAIPLSEVKRHPHGAVFEEYRDIVKPRTPECQHRLQLADPAMLEELARLRAEDVTARRGTSGDYPLQLICRRVLETVNSSPRPEGIVRTGYNPLWMNPADMKALALCDGDSVSVRSQHGEITSFVQRDDTLRPGVVAMTHGFGERHDREYDPQRDGANVNQLISWNDLPDPYHGMPRMSAVPVSVCAAPQP